MKKEEVNQVCCWQKHIDWKFARAVSFDDLKLTNKQLNAIKSGKIIDNGKWRFTPIPLKD